MLALYVWMMNDARWTSIFSCMAVFAHVRQNFESAVGVNVRNMFELLIKNREERVWAQPGERDRDEYIDFRTRLAIKLGLTCLLYVIFMASM